MNTFSISSTTMELTIEKECGNIIAVKAPKLDWDVLDRPHLGRNWQLMIPLPGRRNNPVFGYKQKVSSIKMNEEGTKAVLTWENPSSEYGGVHNIKVIVTVEAIEEAIVWRTTLENHDQDIMIEDACSPIIGDIRLPKDAKEMKTFMCGYSGATTTDVYPKFENHRGYWGVDVPTYMPWNGVHIASPFFLLKTDANKGLYFAPYDDELKFASWRIQLFPGHVTELSNTAPAEDFIGGKEVYRPFDMVHVPLVGYGETYELTPIHIQAFCGDWDTGVDIYKSIRDRVWDWKTPKMPAWAKEPHSWLQLQLNSPEDELRMKFIDLPKVAEECKHYGITAIQLVGWNDGGQDQGNPSHDPDPRLGTFNELKEAIAKCHEIGVKIILFSKFNWADTATDWYKNELHKYEAINLYGVPFRHNGYQYQTITQLHDLNTKRFACMCFLCDDLRKIMQKEFKKMVDLGAAGTLYDECLHHAGISNCCSREHGHKINEHFSNKDNKLIEEFREIAPEDFLFCGEANYDMQMQVYDMIYFRSFGKDHSPIKRYLRPKNSPIMTAVTGFNDRDMINQCLKDNYIVSYEPYYFKGMPSDFPLTMEYGQKMHELRVETRKYTWDGEFCLKNGAKVFNHENKEHEYYSVFRSEEGKLGVVIVNYTDEALSLMVQLDKGTISRWKTVDGSWENTCTITVPAHNAAVAIEE